MIAPVFLDTSGAIALLHSGDVHHLKASQLAATFVSRVFSLLFMEELQALAWTAMENRVLVTNDRNTMVGFAYQRVGASSAQSPGTAVESGARTGERPC